MLWTGNSSGTQANLSAGTLVFTASHLSALEIFADSAHIRAAVDTTTVGQVTVIGPKTLYIYARQGALLFSYEDETEVIPEGKAYRVMLDPPEMIRRQQQASRVLPSSRPRIRIGGTGDFCWSFWEWGPPSAASSENLTTWKARTTPDLANPHPKPSPALLRRRRTRKRPQLFQFVCGRPGCQRCCGNFCAFAQ